MHPALRLLVAPLKGVGGSRPLDGVANVFAAWSLRRLLSSYTGPLIRVRRSSDNAEADIGYGADGYLDVAAFSAHIGVGSGFLTKRYDQSGNHRDQVQATTARQPELRLSVTATGRPAIVGGSTKNLDTGTLGASLAQPYSMYVVAQRTSRRTNFNRALWRSSVGEVGFNNAVNQAYIYGGSTLSAAASDAAFHIIAGTLSGVASKLRVDGIETTGDAGTGVATTQALSSLAGTGGDTAAYLAGNETEAVVFNGALPTNVATIEASALAAWCVGRQAYLATTFFGTGASLEKLQVMTSVDGVAWQGMPANFTPSSGTCRDPSYYFDGEKHWICYTSTAYVGGTTFGLASSTDLVNWTTVANIDCSSIIGIQNPWGPKFFVDGGIPYIVICCDRTGLNNWQPYVLTPVNPSDLSQGYGAPVLITGASLPTKIIDWFQFKKGSTYYVVYKDETTKYICMATSSSPFSGYTVLHSGDWAGWGQREGCSMVYLGGANWRIYMDNYSAGTGMQYSDSADDLATWTAVADISYPIVARNGVFLKLN